MLHSSDWNAQELYALFPHEDLAPASGDPHPLFGPDVTADQLYQNQLMLWLQQNQQQEGNAGNHGHQHAHGQEQDMMELMDEDLPLFNFQAFLEEQGVTFDAGLPPSANNVTDSPMQAWHESITDSDSANSRGSVSPDPYQGWEHPLVVLELADGALQSN
jgi:hypothetical protein